jgi:hypothetical protein
VLLEASFPNPKQRPSYILIVLNYYNRRNYQACLSHRKRRMESLKKWKSLKGQNQRQSGLSS